MISIIKEFNLFTKCTQNIPLLSATYSSASFLLMCGKFNCLAHCTWLITCCLMWSPQVAKYSLSGVCGAVESRLAQFLFRNSTPRLSCIFIKFVGSVYGLFTYRFWS